MADAVADPPEDALTEEQPAPEADDAKAKKADAKAKKPSKKDVAKGKEKGKKGKDAGPPAAGDAPNIAAHPRAVRSIALVKSWCGLAGFLITGYFSLSTSTFVGTGLRALLAGIICYVAGWGAAVFVWRRLVVLEIKAREQQLMSELLAQVGPPAGAAPGAAAQAGARDAP